MFDTTKEKVIVGVAALAVSAGAIGAVTTMGKVEIISSKQAVVMAKQPYQDCKDVETTHMEKNHKNGTEGAIIGGVGGAAVGGLISHSWVGAGVGAAVGAVGGDLVQRSRQPDYVEKHGTKTKCDTAYKEIQVPVGYQVTYINSEGKPVSLVVAHDVQAGIKVKLKELESDQVTPQQQQTLVDQATGVQPNTQPATQGANTKG